jgi:hypothetical protein
MHVGADFKPALTTTNEIPACTGMTAKKEQARQSSKKSTLHLTPRIPYPVPQISKKMLSLQVMIFCKGKDIVWQISL